MPDIATAAFSATLLALMFCLALAPLAIRLGWVDQPDWRKQHSGLIPLVGGPAMFLAFLAVLAWRGGWSQSVHVLAWSSAIILVTGLIDDRRHVRVPVNSGSDLKRTAERSVAVTFPTIELDLILNTDMT